jgi:zinc transporter 1/2/3
MYMIELAPDAASILQEYLTEPYNIDYNVAEFVTACGFLLMLLSEVLIHQIRPSAADHHKGMQPSNSKTEVGTQYSGREISFLYNNACIDKKLAISCELLPDVNCDTGAIPVVGSGSIKGMASLLNIGFTAGLTPARSIGFNQTTKHLIKVEYYQQSHEWFEDTSSQKGHAKSSHSIVLLIALSLHHIFEGLSIGLKTSSAAVWHMCICIVSHETIISFSLGMQLAATFDSRTKVTIAAALCAAISPIGTIMGILIVETGGESNNSVQIINGLLQAVATGIFIYVTFFEILQGEFNRCTGNNLIRVATVTLGFLVISAFGLLPKDDYNPDHDTQAFTEFITLPNLNDQTSTLQ